MFTDELYHVGTPHEADGTPHSGRYAYGTGDNPNQHVYTFVKRVKELKDSGLTKDSDIAKALNMSIDEYRARNSYAKNIIFLDNYNQAIKLKKKGYSNTEIARQMNVSVTKVNNLIASNGELKKTEILPTMNVLKEQFKTKTMIDVGKGVEYESGLNGITADKLNWACIMLQKEEGYTYENIKISQVTSKNKTTVQVLAKPGIDKQYIYDNRQDIETFSDYCTGDGGRTWYKLRYPSSVDSKKVMIRYAEDGGAAKDGIIEIRRGVPGLDLGGKSYAQVRIAVDDSHYMKGMAVYSDNIPEGYDFIVNSNKASGTDKMKCLKEFKTLPDGSVDKSNPFGASINAEVGQRDYVDPADGKTKLSPINIVKPEGEWNTYRKDLASQFLSKQDLKLIKDQTKLNLEFKKTSYEDIMNVQNAAVREKLLLDFAEETDKSAYELRGAALPGQSSKVILPVPSLKDGECYAPTFPDGEDLILVRFPHEGTYQIPVVKNNIKNREGKSTVGPLAIDAIGINSDTASQLSGADFDGDSVIAIPVRDKKFVTHPAIKELVDFDTKVAYPGPEKLVEIYNRWDKNKESITPEELKQMRSVLMTTEKERNLQMGIASNLITDMTFKNASTEELIRATKYSMVVIDALKHNLDYKQAKKDLRIAELHKKYQGKTQGGASTIVSRAKKEIDTDAVSYYRIDPKTGKKIPVYKKKFNKETGEFETAKEKKEWMSTTDDAFDLVGDPYHKKEVAYAEYANNLKDLANQARKDSVVASKDIGIDKEAAKQYQTEVENIKNKIIEAKKSAPRERMAQRQAAYIRYCKINEYGGEVSKDQYKKITNQAIAEARSKYNSKRYDIKLTPKEWEAISHNALHKTLVRELLSSMNKDNLLELAMPKSTTAISPSKKARAKAMAKNGYTLEEIATALNISVTAVANVVS